MRRILFGLLLARVIKDFYQNKDIVLHNELNCIPPWECGNETSNQWKKLINNPLCETQW